MNAKNIEKKLKNKIKEGAIQRVINDFFYTMEYLNWLKNNSTKVLQPKKENFANRWEFILDFDNIIEPKEANIASILYYKRKRANK